ncbi:MAG: hypothetical protein U9P50_03510 [Patescibacteria group bacterium]|nr:hypothetical protein [Patescibacteria group bacterium]
MKKQKYLIFLVVLSFIFANHVFANNEEPGTPQATLGSPKPMNTSTAPVQNPSTPSLLQQEVRKIKTNTTFNSLQRPTSVKATTSTNTFEKNTQRSTTEDQAKNRRIEHIKGYLKNIAGRFHALVQREYQIKNRIQSRLTKLEENGFDMSESKILLSEVDTNFETIKNRVETFRNEILTELESANLEGLFERVREETQSLKTEAQNAHTKLVQIVQKMKESFAKGQQNSKENPTSEDE